MLLLFGAIGVVACSESAPPRASQLPASQSGHHSYSYASTGYPVAAEPFTVATCSLHNAPLEEAEVEILYGLPYLAPPNYNAVRASKFPYSRGLIAGGCSIAQGQATVASVNRCPACTEAECAWLQAGDP